MKRGACRAQESFADLSDREGTPAWECPSAAVLVFNLGVGWGKWGKGKQSCGFQPSAPPQPGTPFRVALFFDFTVWRYWAHDWARDSAPGRGEGEGEARPSGFTLGGWAVLTQAEKSKRSDAGEISAPPACSAAPLDLGCLVWAGWASFSALGIRFLPVSVLKTLPH